MHNRERHQSTYHERDEETGLDYRGARFYDGEVGRFLSCDPLALDYASWSSYHYVADNPILLTDPTGMAWSETNAKLATGWYAGNGPDDFDYIYDQQEDGSWQRREAVEGEYDGGEDFHTFHHKDGKISWYTHYDRHISTWDPSKYKKRLVGNVTLPYVQSLEGGFFEVNGGAGTLGFSITIGQITDGENIAPFITFGTLSSGFNYSLGIGAFKLSSLSSNGVTLKSFNGIGGEEGIGLSFYGHSWFSDQFSPSGYTHGYSYSGQSGQLTLGLDLGWTNMQTHTFIGSPRKYHENTFLKMKMSGL